MKTNQVTTRKNLSSRVIPERRIIACYWQFLESKGAGVESHDFIYRTLLWFLLWDFGFKKLTLRRNNTPIAAKTHGLLIRRFQKEAEDGTGRVPKYHYHARHERAETR